MPSTQESFRHIWSLEFLLSQINFCGSAWGFVQSQTFRLLRSSVSPCICIIFHIFPNILFQPHSDGALKYFQLNLIFYLFLLKRCVNNSIVALIDNFSAFTLGWVYNLFFFEDFLSLFVVKSFRKQIKGNTDVHVFDRILELNWQTKQREMSGGCTNGNGELYCWNYAHILK